MLPFFSHSSKLSYPVIICLSLVQLVLQEFLILLITEEARLAAEQEEAEKKEREKVEAEERRRLENEVRISHGVTVIMIGNGA